MGIVELFDLASYSENVCQPTRPERGLQLRKKANYEIIRQFRCTVLIYFDWLMGWDTKCVTN